MTMDSNVSRFTVRRFGYGSLLLAVLLAMAIPTSSQDNKGNETIDAIAQGTSTQLGHQVSIKITIYRYSTDDDRKLLVAAFQKGQNPGLVKQLENTKAVGRIAITGTLGYDLAYIRLFKTPEGRKIRFATSRLIRFREAYWNSQSQDFDLTAGEINFVDADKKKTEGVLYPASQLIVNKDGELQFELRQNPWKLINIIDWDGAGKEK
jgi:hypothetical protein